MHNWKLNIKIAFTILFAAFLQLSFLDYFSIFFTKPDIMLIIVFFFAFYGSINYSISIGIVVGFLKDILSLGPFGLNLVLFTGSAVFVLQLARYFGGSKLIKIPITFITTFILFSAVAFFLTFVLLVENGFEIISKIPFLLILSKILIKSIYTTVVSIPLFFLLNKLFLPGLEAKRTAAIVSLREY